MRWSQKDQTEARAAQSMTLGAEGAYEKDSVLRGSQEAEQINLVK